MLAILKAVEDVLGEIASAVMVPLSLADDDELTVSVAPKKEHAVPASKAHVALPVKTIVLPVFNVKLAPVAQPRGIIRCALAGIFLSLPIKKIATPGS